MNEPIFYNINQNFIAEHILYAEKTIYLAIPGVTKKITDALIESSKRLGGWENIKVVIDPSPKYIILDMEITRYLSN